jgi:hypothetical protein
MRLPLGCVRGELASGGIVPLGVFGLAMTALLGGADSLVFFGGYQFPDVP